MHKHTHTHLTPATCGCFFINTECSRHLILVSVRMVLLGEGANPCECHVIDDTDSFQTILILHTSTCDCSVTDSFLTPFLSALCTSTHTHLTPVVVSSSTLSAPKKFNLDSVRMVLLDEAASPCECLVIDDTPCFLTIVILHSSTCDCSVTNSFLTSSPLSYAQAHTHTPHPSHMWLFLDQH